MIHKQIVILTSHTAASNLGNTGVRGGVNQRVDKQILSEKTSGFAPHRLARWFISRDRLLAGSIALIFMLSVSFLGLRWLENAITFHPVSYNSSDAWIPANGAQDVWFKTADGVRLHGWLFQPQAKTLLASVIYFHGNGGNITNVGWVGERLAARGFRVLLFDYRGYGRSEGEIDGERSLYVDADAAYDFMTRNGSNERLVLYGQSLGTTAVADVASRRPCRAVILESGFASASNMAANVFPWFPRSLHFLLKNKFESAKKLTQIKSAVLITHGEPDFVIPTDQGRLLFAAANEPKKLMIFPGAGHNVFGSQGDGYLDLVSTFIRDSVK